ncbi:MAG: HAMP domain-containing sensor histidine kinase [Candidatus Limnocylindrales bacterium]
MFRRARVRLTLQYIGLFALVIGAFSVVFYVALSTVLAPTFDLAPDLSSEQVAEVTYQAAIERIGIALLVANLMVVALVGAAAWILASRTLAPIREAHTRQRRFVADASHEMRTPLTTIRATGEGALLGSLDAAGLRVSVATMVDSAERLTHLTNDLLLLARSDEKVIDRRIEPLNLSVLAAETVEAFAAAHPDLAQARMSLAPDARVAADPDELGRIVANLLDNAFRYGGGSGGDPPRVVTRASDRDVEIEVTDSGPGIGAADLDRIFEPFYRVQAHAGSPEGTGLGLAIARSLAERNHGRLDAVSRPGEGATFRLLLPRLR